MTIPPWEWEARAFIPDADLTKTIRNALGVDRPEAFIYSRWPWIPEPIVEDFIEEAFTAEGDDLAVLVERFQHTIRAYWSEKYEPKVHRRAQRHGWWRSWWRT